MIAVSGTCGAGATVIADDWGQGNASGPVGNTMSFELGTPNTTTLGNEYKLCWAHAPESDVAIEVDAAFAVTGATAGSLACTLGVECTVVVSGYDFHIFV